MNHQCYGCNTCKSADKPLEEFIRSLPMETSHHREMCIRDRVIYHDLLWLSVIQTIGQRRRCGLIDDAEDI